MTTVTDVTIATAILNECMKGDKPIFKGAMPETNEGKVEAANRMLATARQAITAGIQSEVAKTVVNLAENSPAVAAAPAAEENPFAAAEATPSPPAAAAPASPPAQAPEPPPAPTATVPTVGDLFAPDDYDDLRVDDIVEKMAGMNAEQIAVVKAHEASDGGRGKILKFEKLAEAAPAPQAPIPETSAPQFNITEKEQFAKTEPWVGYDSAKIPAIFETVETLFKAEGEKGKLLLAHVWEYEKSHGERKTLFKKLQELAQNGVQSAPPAAPVVEDPDVKPEPPFEQPAAASTPETPATPAPVTASGDITQPFDGATQAIDSAIAAEGLPVPAGLQGAPPELPENFVDVGLAELGTLSSQFNACQARSNYLADVAAGHSNDARLVADQLVRDFRNANEWAKGTTEGAIEAKATESADVQHARRVQHEYSALSRRYKVLADTYGNTIERISRELTRRQIAGA